LLLHPPLLLLLRLIQLNLLCTRVVRCICLAASALVVASSAAAAIALIRCIGFIVASAAAAAMALASAASAFVPRRLLHLFQLRLLVVASRCCRYCIDSAASALLLHHLLLPLWH
jgi:hypothetical protein